MPRSAFEELDDARAAVLAEADVFTQALAPALEGALRRGVERLQWSQSDRLEALDEGGRDELGTETEIAIAAGVEATLDRLRTPEVWLTPLTAPDLPAVGEQGWGLLVPSWVASLLRGRSSPPPQLGGLDDPTNRIWVAISAAAAPLDPVLERYGFRPEHGRRVGGGRFGVGPRTLPQLDPSGALARRWRAYRAAYGRFSALLASSA